MFYSKRLTFAIAALALAACGASAQNIVPDALLAVDQNRSTVVERIVNQWGDRLAASNAGIGAAELREMLSAMRSDHLLAASLAGTLEGLRDVVAKTLIPTGEGKASLLQPKALGDTSDDLVYTPVVPCRIVDTRNAGGAIGASSSRDFKVWVSSGGFTAQGGSATNCNIPANPTAVVLNITAVTPAGAGNFIAYPTGSPTFTSVLNYQSGENALANGAIVPACVPDCTNQLTIATNGAGADAVIDIAGYFNAPAATALDCTTVAASVTVAHGTFGNVSTAVCPAGYTTTGGGCNFFNTDGTSATENTVIVNRGKQFFDTVTMKFTNQWVCRMTNNDPVKDFTIQAVQSCCRVPGH